VPLTSTSVEPHRVTRAFFDCRAVVPKTADLWRIEQAIERSIALPEADDDAQVTLSWVALRPLPRAPGATHDE
jgi:hypothetical protein